MEELLRTYFRCHGFVVFRSVPVSVSGKDLTDIDLWLYEQTRSGERRVRICDIKYKQRPKAAERIFWTKGLSDTIGADGAFVATPDKRHDLRAITDRIGLQLIDGHDIDRIDDQYGQRHGDRLSDELLVEELALADQASNTTTLQRTRRAILAHLPHDFGSLSAFSSIRCFATLAQEAVSCHPDSIEAHATGRLSYLVASVACASLDYVSTRVVVASPEERRQRVLEAVQLGSLNNQQRSSALDMAITLVAEYGLGDKQRAASVQAQLRAALERIPADIVADQASRLFRDEQLFRVARDLEDACYRRNLPAFDDLPLEARSMVAAFLDFVGVDRVRFACAWTTRAPDKTRKTRRKSTTAKLTNPPRLLSDQVADN